jgi:hypothetical protein
LKAFSIRDCLSGPLFRAILISAALLGLILGVAFMHLKLFLAAPLIIFCFAFYTAAFWIFAVDPEDRSTISSFRQRAFAMLRGRRTAVALQITGNDAAL